MSTVYGSYGPANQLLGKFWFNISRPIFRYVYSGNNMFGMESDFARKKGASMRSKLENGEPVYLIGIGPSGQNSGIALVEVTKKNGLRLICNEEEERYVQIKHCTDYPERGIDVIKRRLSDIGITPHDIHACITTWTYDLEIPYSLKTFFEHFPRTFSFLNPDYSPHFNTRHILDARKAPLRLGRQLGVNAPMPIITMPHHDTHAYFSYASSPFNALDEPVMICVIDGFGDDNSVSLYIAEKGNIRVFQHNKSIFDSLGMMYYILSSTQGGWTPLSSEGRYMGAAAWGNGSRLTNPYYKRLRQLFYFGPNGGVHLNRRMGEWHLRGCISPYTRSLEDVIGKAIPKEKMWNPDAVLSVEDVVHSEITRERVDKAAAVQLLFEDMLFHIIEHLIINTGSDKLVLAGGTALNCVANMRLLENYNETFYKRYLKKSTRLNIWVPPVPGDAGAPIGAAYSFAMKNGAPMGDPMTHAFYCGYPPSADSIHAALRDNPEFDFIELGNIHDDDEMRKIADFVAYVISQDGVLGIFQGPAETGPRALGHRSILANPCNPKSLENINAKVKFREKLRPLAPMATLSAALEFFDLLPGASADNYNAYNYMVLTANAKPKAYEFIPAVVHFDGTSRVQIVREEVDPFCHAILKAMGARLGVEVAVNTSLNVGSPIVQTPEQALVTLRRSKAMNGIVMIGDNGDAFLVWHNIEDELKDAGRVLMSWLKEWEVEAAQDCRISARSN